MTLSGYLYLVGQHLQTKKWRTCSLIFGLSLGIILLVVSLSLILGLRNSLIPKIKRAYPEDVLIAQPPRLDVNLIRVPTMTINQEIIDKIKGLDGVSFASPQVGLNFPASAERTMFGELYLTDVVVNGVDPELVAADIAPGKVFAYQPQGPVPAIISRYFLDLYNLGMAESLNLPMINPDKVIGKKFYLLLGQSSLGLSVAEEKKRRIECELVGFTPNVSLPGLILPRRHVEEFNRSFWDKDKTHYLAVHIGLTSLEYADRVIDQVKSMGLEVTTGAGQLKNFLTALNIAQIVLLAFSLAILAVAIVNVANAFSLLTIERRGEIGLLRVLGSSGRLVSYLFLLELAGITLVAGVIGSLVALGLLLLLQSIMSSYFSFLSYWLAGLFYLRVWLFIFGALFSLPLSIIVVLPLITRILKALPAELLRTGIS